MEPEEEMVKIIMQKGMNFLKIYHVSAFENCTVEKAERDCGVVRATYLIQINGCVISLQEPPTQAWSWGGHSFTHNLTG